MHNIVRKYALTVALYNMMLEAAVEEAMRDPQIQQLVQARKTLEELTDRLRKHQGGQQ
jgi:hypothetical protein